MMPKERLTILILDSTRQALPFLRSLREAGHRPIVACESRWDVAYWSRYAAGRFLVPGPDDDFDGFCEAILRYIETRGADVAMGLSDPGARALSLHKERFSRSVKIVVPDWEVFRLAMDKGETMRFCASRGIPHPKTWLPSERPLEEILAEATYPAIVKPRVSAGALGLRRANDRDELRNYLRTLPSVYGDMLVQEYIPIEGGTQYQAEAFVDARGTMRACVVILKPRFFPVTGGTSTANQTIEHPRIRDDVRRLLEGLEWTGAADVDLILDPRDNVAKVLEINPRVTAGIKIAFAAGVDFADLTLRLALGREVPDCLDYRLGMYCRNLPMDVLWYLFSDREARRTTPLPFWKFFGKNVTDQVLSCRDPLPGLAFLAGMARKYAKPGVFLEKLGHGRKTG